MTSLWLYLRPFPLKFIGKTTYPNHPGWRKIVACYNNKLEDF
jgi:hypothetical protein